ARGRARARDVRRAGPGRRPAPPTRRRRRLRRARRLHAPPHDRLRAADRALRARARLPPPRPLVPVIHEARCKPVADRSDLRSPIRARAADRKASLPLPLLAVHLRPSEALECKEDDPEVWVRKDPTRVVRRSNRAPQPAARSREGSGALGRTTRRT